MNFSTTTLSVGGYSARIMEAERLVGDRVFGLPPGNALKAYRVGQFIKKPDHWIDDNGSFVVVVKPNKGLWFDWTANDGLNTAVLPTVKGCNPITGLATEGFSLEKIADKCPKCGDKLNSKNFCKQCGYEHPHQNYVSAPNTLWWDGFRSEDGSVRQFFFSEDEMRDVASHLIGKENTVPAFGFAFYNKKAEFRKQKPKNEARFGTCSTGSVVSKGGSKTVFGSCSGGTLSKGSVGDSPVMYFGDNMVHMKGLSSMNLTNSVGDSVDNHVYCCATTDGTSLSDMTSTAAMSFMDCSLSSEPKSRGIEVRSKSVSVGAGAKINQQLQEDTAPISEWMDEPDAIMRIYFVFEEEFAKWRSFGMKCVEDVQAGMLKGIPVG